MKLPPILFRDGKVYTNSAFIYWGLILLESIVVGLLCAYVVVPTVQWLLDIGMLPHIQISDIQLSDVAHLFGIKLK